MHVHFDCKMLLLWEEENHFAYVRVMGERQGFLLSA